MSVKIGYFFFLLTNMNQAAFTAITVTKLKQEIKSVSIS